MDLTLTIELVPAPLWGVNPRNAMGRAEWDRVRKSVYAEYSYRCGICNSEGVLEAHEQWEYEDELLVQRLVRIIALCRKCHGVKHLARSSIVNKAAVTQLRDHFLQVNQCSGEAFVEHFKEVGASWRLRSAHDGWTVDWGEYAHLVENAGEEPESH